MLYKGPQRTETGEELFWWQDLSPLTQAHTVHDDDQPIKCNSMESQCFYNNLAFTVKFISKTYNTTCT